MDSNIKTIPIKSMDCYWSNFINIDIVHIILDPEDKECYIQWGSENYHSICDSSHAESRHKTYQYQKNND